MDYELQGPDGAIYKLEHRDETRPNAIWRWSKTKVQESFDQLVFKDGHVYTKNYEKSGGKPRSLFVDERFGRTRSGSSEVIQLLGGSYFENPKPTKLLKTITAIATDKEAIVLDFFAGSGSTANAVMALNAEDGGNRRFIQVQLPEPTLDDSDAGKAGFNTIADISRHRIALACEKLETEVAEKLGHAGENFDFDFGFRAYRLAETGFSKWRVSSDVELTALEQHLFDLKGSSDDSASADDLLAEILLKQGYSLSESIEPTLIAGLELSSVGNGLVLAYLNEHVKPTLDSLRLVMDSGPSKFIILEDAFQGDDQLKTNLAQLCKSKSVELWTA